MKQLPEYLVFVELTAESAMLSPVLMIYSIVAVELTLMWNHVTNIYEVKSTGQALALVFGAANFASLLWELLGLSHTVCLSMKNTKEVLSDCDRTANRTKRQCQAGAEYRGNHTNAQPGWISNPARPH